MNKMVEGGYTTPLFNSGPLSNYHIFSAGEYVGMLNFVMHLKLMRASTPLYNNAYVFHIEAKNNQHSWWRADGTPSPQDQVPKEYLAYAALLK